METHTGFQPSGRQRGAITLAAVVIGGLVSSTLLTLYLLPTLYRVFERDDQPAPEVRLPEPPSTQELT